MTSALLTNVEGVEAIPLLWNEHGFIPHTATRASDVIQVVLENIPLPDEQTSLQDLLEFRNDPSVKAFHLNLRRWIALATTAEMSPRDLAGEIESSVYKYQKYMHEYRVKSVAGTWEMIIKTSAFGAIAGIGVDERAALVGTVGAIAATLRRRRAELMMAEISAPGSELAFISKARERFGK